MLHGAQNGSDSKRGRWLHCVWGHLQHFLLPITTLLLRNLSAHLYLQRTPLVQSLSHKAG